MSECSVHKFPLVVVCYEKAVCPSNAWTFDKTEERSAQILYHTKDHLP